MPLNFPTNPATNDTYTFNSVTWVWTGTRWEVQSSGSGGGVAQVYDVASTSTGYFDLPSGNTLQRPATPDTGMIRYNSTTGFAEVYTSVGWGSFGAQPPSISTVAPASYNGEAGTVFTINGANFTADATVKFVDVNSVEYTAAVVTFVNSGTLTATTPQDFTVAQEPLDVKVIQASGQVTKLDCIDCGGTPSWTTAAGTLADLDENKSLSVTLVATDPDAGATVTYHLISGSLPAGVALDSNTGVISGTTANVTVDTTSSFTIGARDNAGNQTTRNFDIIVRNNLINTVDFFGDSSGVALYSLDNTINDVSGSYNGTGAIAGSLTYSTSVKRFGTHSFNAAKANSIRIPNLKNSYPFSVSAWIYLDSTKFTDTGMSEVMNTSTAGQRVSITVVDWSSDGTWQIGVMYGGTNHWTFGPNLTKDTWLHIVWSVVGSNNSSHAMYLNGVAQSGTNRGGGHGGTAGWALGGNNDGSELFKGYLDQVRFFNKALSAAEALQLYNHENPRS